jgi:hypothetical protein
LILDKTVLEEEGVEHRSLNWILTNQKYVKPNSSQYELSEDYFGFFPVNRLEYQVKDLMVFDTITLNHMADSLEFAFYTDAYGIYSNEWIYNRDINERSRLIYGGLSPKAYYLFKQLYRKRKLTISEFNNLASPTALQVRFAMQDLLENDFTGWTGRYYHSLDTIKNPDIPRWMRRLHLRYYDRPFDYPDIPGIVFVHETERIFVLQDELDLEHEIPIINTPDSMQDYYGLPAYMRYPYWFDVTFAKDSSDILASYKVHTTERGDSMFSSHGLPTEFPAIIGVAQENLRWYFCGDWSDSRVPFGLSYFKGVQFFRKFFYNNQDELDRKKFFWEYYEPLVSRIFADYYELKDSLTPLRPLPPLHLDYQPYYRRNNIPQPDIDLIVSGRVYDPDTVYGTELKERAYRDSLRQAELREAREAGYYIGEYGDTVYVTSEEERKADSIKLVREREKRTQEIIEMRRRQEGSDPDSSKVEPVKAPLDTRFQGGGRLPLYRIEAEDAGSTTKTESNSVKR